MNKFFAFTCAFMVCASMFAADYARPKRAEKDPAILQAAFDNAPAGFDKWYCESLLNLSKNNYKTLAEVKAMVEATSAKHFKKQNKDTLLNFVKMTGQEFPQFRAEAFKMAKTDPSSSDIAMYIYWDKGLSEVEVYNGIMTSIRNVINNPNARPDLIKRGVEKLVRIGAGNTSITTQKADLQYLNRAITPKVLIDASKWEPVCSLIRTALETY